MNVLDISLAQTAPLHAHSPSSALLLHQKAPKKAKKRTAEGANSNVFSMFEQAQIQEFKEVRAAAAAAGLGAFWSIYYYIFLLLLLLLLTYLT